MDKKSTRILLSILHICILGICILTIYNNKHSTDTVVHVSFDTKTAVTPKETDEEPGTELEPKPESETEPETKSVEEPEADTGTAKEAKPEPEIDTSMEAAQETQTAETPESTALYFFRFLGTRNELNIRSAPSMDADIISKVPVGGQGSVLGLTDDDWVRIEYDGTVGYCSRSWIELQEITE